MTRAHTLLALLVVLVWGVNFVVIDAGLADVPPLVLLALRFLLVAVPAVFFVKRPPVRWQVVVGVGLFMSLGQFALLYLALHLGMPAGLASLVLQAQIVLTVIIAAIALKERPTRMQVLGLAIGVAGLAVVAWAHAGVGVAAGDGAGSVADGGSAGSGAAGAADGGAAVGGAAVGGAAVGGAAVGGAAVGGAAWLPLVVTLAAALSWAIGNVISRKAVGASGLSLVVWSALVVPVPAFLLALIVEGPSVVAAAIAGLTPVAVFSTLYTVVFASLIGYAIWNSLLARYPAAKVVPFALLIPVVGIAAAWLFQNEVPTVGELVGGAVMVAGLAVAVLRARAGASAEGRAADSAGAQASGATPATARAVASRRSR